MTTSATSRHPHIHPSRSTIAGASTTKAFTFFLHPPITLLRYALALALLGAGALAPLYAQDFVAPAGGAAAALDTAPIGRASTWEGARLTASPKMTPVGYAPATLAQQRYPGSSLIERINVVEEIGEVGARQWALGQSWTELLPRDGRLLRQGLDQVYKDADGCIHVIEAKGGGSPLNRAYGHIQGTPEWAVESAKRVARSPKASLAERRVHMAVIRAASEGKLQVSVLRTRHVLGEAGATVFEGTKPCTPMARSLATQAVRSLRASLPAMEAVARGSAEGLAEGEAIALKAARGGSRWAKGARLLGPVAVVVDGGLRVKHGAEIAEAYGAGELTVEEHEILQVENATGMLGGWGAALPCAAFGAKLCSAFGPWGTAAGGLFGGVGGYVVGEEAVEAGSVYVTGAIHATGHTIGGTASNAWDATTSGIGTAKDAVVETAGDAWGYAASGASQAADACSEAASSAWSWTSDKAGDAWNWLVD